VIVVAGEALIDLVTDGGHHLVPHCGGGPFNTARALARLGQPVSFLGCLSEDAFGRQLRAQLDADGVSLGTAIATTLPTTLAVAELGDDGSASYRFYTEATSAPALEAADALGVFPAGVQWLHLGTLGLVLSPIAETLLAVLESPPAERAMVMLDPNIRSLLIDDRARYLRRFERVLRRSDVVKASAEDLAWLLPGAPMAEAAAALLAQGPSVVLVTLGAEGALVVTREEVLAVPAVPAAVLDTIGAGDAFGAAFVAWWRSHELGRRELTDPEALRAAAAFACLVAARTCEQAGATPPRMPVGR
jgi:fructokinase